MWTWIKEVSFILGFWLSVVFSIVGTLDVLRIGFELPNSIVMFIGVICVTYLTHRLNKKKDETNEKT